jgi:hypothetical protein
LPAPIFTITPNPVAGSLKPLQNPNGSLKPKMDRRRLAAKQRLTGFTGWNNIRDPLAHHRF